MLLQITTSKTVNMNICLNISGERKRNDEEEQKRSKQNSFLAFENENNFISLALNLESFARSLCTMLCFFSRFDDDFKDGARNIAQATQQTTDKQDFKNLLNSLRRRLRVVKLFRSKLLNFLSCIVVGSPRASILFFAFNKLPWHFENSSFSAPNRHKSHTVRWFNSNYQLFRRTFRCFLNGLSISLVCCFPFFIAPQHISPSSDSCTKLKSFNLKVILAKISFSLSKLVLCLYQLSICAINFSEVCRRMLCKGLFFQGIRKRYAMNKDRKRAN